MKIRDITKRLDCVPIDSTHMKGIWKPLIKIFGIVFAIIIAVSLLNFSVSPSRYASNQITNEGIERVELHSGVYIGNIMDDNLSGEGNFIFLDGTIYTGSWEESKMSGEGVCEYPGIGEYKGTFEGGMRSGEGVFTWADGKIAEGTWKNDEIVDGKITFPDGSFYTGSFSGGHIDAGKYIEKSTPSEEETAYKTHAVSFENGKPSTEEYVLNNGFTYNGSVKAGEASITYPNGDTYQGYVDDTGIPDGTGSYIWKENEKIVARYEGQWVSGVMNGQGKYYYTNSALPCLSGNFVDGVPDGICTYSKEDGNTFQATWESGKCVKIE